eukprot:TRINITY_DN4261_c0_g3_i6.p1 TRINITY_DN4261_c0_g3~~TRINITY_DN4261_c0_g3_i6.p1  ORF type:complete len:243 (+),score=-9.58 TRINITY_DN4261_c0_g3_i6:196-924(+)
MKLILLLHKQYCNDQYRQQAFNDISNQQNHKQSINRRTIQLICAEHVPFALGTFLLLTFGSQISQLKAAQPDVLASRGCDTESHYTDGSLHQKPLHRIFRVTTPTHHYNAKLIQKKGLLFLKKNSSSDLRRNNPSPCQHNHFFGGSAKNLETSAHQNSYLFQTKEKIQVDIQMMYLNFNCMQVLCVKNMSHVQENFQTLNKYSKCTQQQFRAITIYTNLKVITTSAIRHYTLFGSIKRLLVL